MIIATVQPFSFLEAKTVHDESRVYTSYGQNVSAATAFITSQRVESGHHILVRASTVDDNSLFLKGLISKHSEVRDQISYLLFAIREAFPTYTSSTIVKARYQHGLSSLPRFSAAHSCLTPHIIDNLYPSIIENVIEDLSKEGKISEKTKQEIGLLLHGEESNTFTILIQELEKVGSEVTWAGELAKRKALNEQVTVFQATFIKWSSALKGSEHKETQTFLLKAGQINVAIQKIGKPTYPEIQESSTTSETIKNIDQALVLIDSNEERSNPASTRLLEGTRERLVDLRGQITASVFYRLEALLKRHERESVISTNSVMYQNMNITTEFPYYVNSIVDMAIELEFRDYSIYLQNQVSHGKMSSKEAFTLYCERKIKFLKRLVQTFEEQFKALNDMCPHIQKLRSIATSLSSANPKDFQTIFALILEMRSEWTIIQSLRAVCNPTESRAFGPINSQIKDLLDPNNYLQESFGRTDFFLQTLIKNAKFHIVEGGHIRQTLESALLCVQTANPKAKEDFERIAALYKTDVQGIRSLPVPSIKKFLFNFFDYFFDRFGQKRYYESIKDDEEAVRQFLSNLAQPPAVSRPFSEYFMSSDPTSYFHNTLLARKFIDEKKDFSTCSLDQLREIANSYFLHIYDFAFQNSREPFKQALTEIRKLKRDQETREEFEVIKRRFANSSLGSTSDFAVLMQEAGITSFLTAPKINMLAFVDKLSVHLQRHPEQIIFIRDSIANTIYQYIMKFSMTSFNVDEWREIITTVKKCKEASEEQLRGSLRVCC